MPEFVSDIYPCAATTLVTNVVEEAAVAKSVAPRTEPAAVEYGFLNLSQSNCLK